MLVYKHVNQLNKASTVQIVIKLNFLKKFDTFYIIFI